MRRLIALISCGLMVCSPAFTQPPDTLWTRTWDYFNGTEVVTCIRPTFDGGLILSGYGQSEGIHFHAWVMKTDVSGGEIWSRMDFGGISEASDYIEQTSDGGYIECGETWSYSPYNDWDGYVRKLDADGNQVWARLLGVDAYLDYQLCVREVPAGGYVTFGAIEGALTVVRLGPNGGTLWTQPFPPELGAAHFIEPTQDGGFLLAANYYNGHFVVAKLSSTGDLIWSRDLMEEFGGSAECIRELPDQTIVACGYVGVGFDGGAFYTVRLDSDGNVIWDDVIDHWNSQRAYDLWITPENSIVVCGYSQDPNWYHYYLFKYDIDGNLLWELSLPGGDWNNQSICQMRDGGYVFGGRHSDLELGESLDFHIIKTYPEVTVELTPETTLFPSTGGTLVFDELMANILITPTDFDRWTLVLGQDDFFQAYPPITVTLQPGETVTNENEQLVIPTDWPDGEYAVELHYGNHPHPMANMGLGTIQIQKGEGNVTDPNNPSQPSEFVLSDPWPNPFNSSTTITVDLPAPSDLHVTVFNMTGQHVATLTDGFYPAGTHEITFAANGLASGIYFVQAILADQTSITRKVMLIR